MSRDELERLDARADADEGLPATRPDPAFTTVATWVLHAFADVAVLRHDLLHRMMPAGTAAAPTTLGTVADNLVMVASELATNALRHGRPPPTVVRLLRHRQRLCLDVADHDPAGAPVIAGRREAGEGGYGLLIARRLAQDVGWYASDGAKHVWATFPAPV